MLIVFQADPTSGSKRLKEGHPSGKPKRPAAPRGANVTTKKGKSGKEASKGKRAPKGAKKAKALREIRTFLRGIRSK